MYERNTRGAPDLEIEDAREQVGRALEVAFARWGEWHRVERAPPGPRQEEARLRIARAEDELIAAQHRLEDAESRAHE